MTYRERRERKAEKLRDWSDKRRVKAETAFGTAHRIGDGIPFGQPILVGHHSEKRHRRDIARIDAGMRNGIEHTRTADDMESRATNIERALDRAIYDDDPDAIERLQEKLAGLEAKREGIKAFNKTHVLVAESRWRPEEGYTGKVIGKRTGFVTVERKDGTTEEVPRTRTHPAMSSYVLQNLGGVITTTRKRIAALEARKALVATRASYEADGATVADAAWAGYVEVSHPERPARDLINELKAAGFNWRQGAWFGKREHLPERYHA